MLRQVRAPDWYDKMKDRNAERKYHEILSELDTLETQQLWEEGVNCGPWGDKD